MKLDERIAAAVKDGTIPAAPASMQGVSKAHLREILGKIDRAQDDVVDAVFALLDNTLPSFFTGAKNKGLFFCHGASTAQIACHIGIIQRGKGKLDREGRDYWLKPMWEIGAIEKVYFDSTTGSFLPGHPKAKSGNSAYRLADSFVSILQAPADKWGSMLDSWSAETEIRKRLTLQAELAKATMEGIDSTHLKLIEDCCKYYAVHFLPGFETVYIDDSDGDRITPEEKETLKAAGIELTLDDSMPDVLLWNRNTDWLWVIEAVCSDGEVDLHKIENLKRLAARCGKAGVGFTTAYPDWKTAARRQTLVKNLAVGSFLWIREDGAKHFEVKPPE